MSGPVKGVEFTWDEDGTPRSRRLAPGDVISIGRARQNDIVLTDRQVSRRHCVIRLESDGMVVTDLGSQNGTFVRGERVTTARLEPGERMLIGTTVFSLQAAAIPAEPWLRGKGARAAKIAAAAAIVLAAFLIGRWFVPFLGRGFRTGGGGPLSVATDPPAATVFLDGEYVGLTPVQLVDVSGGRHVLRLAKAGYRPRRVAVEFNHVGRELRYDLEPVVPGQLVVLSDPEGVEVWLDGRLIGTTPLLGASVRAGTRRVELRHPEYLTKQLAVTVSAGSAAGIEVSLEVSAAAPYRERLQGDPNHLASWTEMAHVYLVNGRLAEAERALERAFEVAAFGTDTSGYRRRFMQEMTKLRSGKTFRFKSQDEKNEMLSRIARAVARVTAKHPGRSSGTLRRLHQLFPQRPSRQPIPPLLPEKGADLELMLKVAAAESARGHTVRTAEILRQAIAAAPSDSRPVFRLGEVYADLASPGQTALVDVARQCFQKARDLAPNATARAIIEERLKQLPRR